MTMNRLEESFMTISLDIHWIEQQINDYMETQRVPGLAIAILYDLHIVYTKGFGTTSVEDSGTSVTPKTLFQVGSTTKPLTGTLIMRLVEQGILNLDSPIKNYIPWITFSDPAVVHLITLRMLLSHTSGLPTDGPWGGGDLEAYIRHKIPQYQFVARPGKVWSYSNPGVALAGYVAEFVCQKPFIQLMQEQIFNPLHMERSTFEPVVAMTYPLAQAHTLNPDSTLSVIHRADDFPEHYPAGFATSTVLDMAKFAMMHLNEGRWGEQQILSADSITEMHRAQADLFRLTGEGYGLTFHTGKYKGIQRLEHSGTSSYQSEFVFAPEKKVALILLHNRPHPSDPIRKVVDVILDRLLNLSDEPSTPVYIEPDQSFWNNYVGSYLGGWRGRVDVKVEAHQLIVEWNHKRIPLQALRNNFYCGYRPDNNQIVTIGFVLEQTGVSQYAILNGQPCARVTSPWSPVPERAEWEQYAGTYIGSYDNRLKIRASEEGLLIHHSWLDRELLFVPIDATSFAYDTSVVEFRSENGQELLIGGGVLNFRRVPDQA
jgi:CubicO group peptidase (beta-lactamase class C family)